MEVNCTSCLDKVNQSIHPLTATDRDRQLVSPDGMDMDTQPAAADSFHCDRRQLKSPESSLAGQCF